MAHKKAPKEAPMVYDAAGAFAAIETHHLKGAMLEMFLQVLPPDVVADLHELVPADSHAHAAVAKELAKREESKSKGWYTGDNRP